MRRAKIVATLGPALDDRDKLRGAIEAGIDVVRLNFSHGDPETHARRLEAVREISVKLGRNVGSLADLQGPKIRLGTLPDEGVQLDNGAEVFLQPGREQLDSYESEGQPSLPVVYESLADDVAPGALVLVDDGSIRLVASRHDEGGVWCRVVAGGVAKSKKGVNLPGASVSAPSLTPKDLEDLKTAVDLGADWLALSFVRKAEDPDGAREQIARHGSEAPIVSKLERPEAIDRLDEVISASDAVMVARGDLGVEIGPERVPAIQKQIISKANAASKPVITATEMLESMIDSPRATRAEASDVANAVFDGTDALMLSGETAAGRYPVEAVRSMARIIEVAESSPQLAHPNPDWVGYADEPEVGRVVARAAVQVAKDIQATALVVYSITGSSIQRVSKYRPDVPLLGLTPTETALRRTALMWGTEAGLVPMKEQATDLTSSAERVLVDGNWARRGDQVVIVSGRPGGEGGTNRLMVHRVGDPVVT
ncbi:pyruvate kinase [Egibacter rhizosphaerae]|uniref:Pyruvate kinase n=1 Tax=Egibacter rhizosphaerae TaxID=1670831 RepID=A0A411YIW7_9ACTN|nr:pyruvate kinase [Egibacter rhizosphaerae]QBI21180.1 pyruvate kinase [Egibacter rhizosphaerae]